MKKKSSARVRPFLVLVLLSIVLTGCPPPVEDDPNQNTTVTDIEGNIYKTVTIGTQVWMAENLKTTKYNDGTTIQLVSDNNTWVNMTTPAYCWFMNNATSYKNTYGALYNWYTVNTGKLCPTGYHIPSYDDWSILITFLGGETIAGGKLKETGTIHWNSPNTGATNESGFTALPGGDRFTGGDFVSFRNGGYWWSSTLNSSTAWFMSLMTQNTGAFKAMTEKNSGFSVRCLKD